MKIRFVLVIGIAVLCMGAAKKGCGGTEDAELTSEMKALAEDIGESSGAADTATAIVSIPVFPLTAAGKLATAAAAATAAATVGTFFKPAGCVTATANGTTVAYEFKSCTGPLGLVAVNGKLTASFSLVSNGVEIDVQSETLTLGKTPVEQSAKVTVTFDGTVRKVTWDGGYKGTTNRNKLPIEHTANYTTEFDTATGCVKWNGSGSTTIAERGLTVNVTGYERCGSLWYCPKSGTISATGKQSGLSITLDYLGGGQARITGPNGNSWDYKMLWCIAQ